MLPSKSAFIKATEEYTTLERSVPAHYFRRSFGIPSAIRAPLSLPQGYRLRDRAASGRITSGSDTVIG